MLLRGRANEPSAVLAESPQVSLGVVVIVTGGSLCTDSSGVGPGLPLILLLVIVNEPAGPFSVKPATAYSLMFSIVSPEPVPLGLPVSPS